MKWLAILLLAQLPAWGEAAMFARVHREPFDLIQLGDIHAGGGPGAFSQLNTFTNSINTIIGGNSTGLWHAIAVVSPGDCFQMRADEDRGTNVTVAILTNQFWKLKAAGIPVFTCPGNHDCDAAGATNFWNDYFTTNFFESDSHFVMARTNDDMRDIVYAFTNSGVKLLLISWRWEGDDAGTVFPNTNDVIAAYSPATAWANNLAQTYSNHLFIPVMHYFLNTAARPGFEDDPNSPAGYKNIGPGYEAWTDSLHGLHNSLMVICGHVRRTFYTIGELVCADGHIMRAFKWNTQAVGATFEPNFPPNSGVFVVYHFDPDSETVRARLYNSELQAFMTNSQSSAVSNVDYSFSYRNIP